MKSLIATLALTLFALAPLAASQAQNGEQTERLRQRLEELRDRLALTPEQEEQIRPVLAEEVQKLQALREKYNGGSQNRRSRLRMARELRDIQSDADSKLKEILTKTQMDELKKIREARRAELKDRIGR